MISKTTRRAAAPILFTTAMILACGTVFAANPAKKAATKAPGVKGQQQVAGGDGVFGQTYTMQSGFNYTLVSAEYSVARVCASEALVPEADEKLVVLHFKIKNANPEDEWFNSGNHAYKAVDTDGEDHEGGTDTGRTLTGKQPEFTLKPGQGYDDLYAAIKVPAKGGITKLILEQGRKGTQEEVIRFPIDSAKNIIAPLPEWARDPSDPSGATALSVVPATLATYYPCEESDIRVDSIQALDGSYAGHDPDDGKRFVLVTISLKNGVTSPDSVYGGKFVAKITDSDGDSYDPVATLKARKDEDLEGEIPVGGEIAARWLVQIPKGDSLKTFTIQENGSRTYSYDVSNVK